LLPGEPNQPAQEADDTADNSDGNGDDDGDSNAVDDAGDSMMMDGDEPAVPLRDDSARRFTLHGGLKKWQSQNLFLKLFFC
jgi:hypothetical protein